MRTLSSWGEGQTVKRKRCQFRYSQPGGVVRMEHGTVAQACGGSDIWRIRDCLHLGLIGPVDHGLVDTLVRDCAHLQCKVEASRGT